MTNSTTGSPRRPLTLLCSTLLLALAPLASGQKPLPDLQMIKVNTDGRSLTTITLPPKHQLVFYPIGNWNPAGGGTLLSQESSLGPRGIDTLRWTGYGSDVYRLFKKGESVPGGEFISPKHNFFCLLLKTEAKPEWRPAADVWDHVNNYDKAAARKVTFNVNDQEGQFHNNTSGLYLIYQIRPDNDVPWDVNPDRFDLDKHVRQLDCAKSVLNLPSANGSGSDVDLKCYWYLLRYFDKSAKYDYAVSFWNDGAKAFDGEVQFTDNEKNSVKRHLHVPAGGRESKGVQLGGMTIEKVVPLEYKLKEPPPAKP